MKNKIMIIVAFLAIFAVISGMVAMGKFETTLQSAIDKSTESATAEESVACDHITNSKCICTLCGEEVHVWDTNDMDCQQYGICFYCEAQSTTVKGSIHPDGDNDGFCDLCDVTLS